ncbi:putative alpha,alpha-trehalose phosphate synthase subunit TPS3 [Rhizopus microsporus ATCC 52813]|uniref:Putative alpha,alpha-trehalose phosphate synthase subunit TPS3 n=1 Tax=Rhizopus microsporus ATCC 52813 TaxID=1340429 RepID=A0A2G4TAG5_RHIZD|nr:putative alpha,alpha-trehalose phosphate synthase subunit TPS3 [Rhizopus microsporus ATCC 52813]PHZ17998.1 putative alpha,alpha-trehalose phosphate synthase subunit TPS3 [Rhizopus microsporus ATCC 52813]
MTRVSEKRVVVATLFLPWTVDFELAEKKRKDRLIAKTEEKNNAKPNLIQSLAQHKQPKDAKEELFDFKEPEKLVQPRSKQQREEEIKNAKAFADAPWSVKPTVAGNIGLNNALFSIQDQLESLVWVGTLGMSTDALLKKTKEEINSTFESRYNTYPVMPSDTTFDGHYNQYCKQVLWPYFHYVVRDDCHNMMSQNGPYQLYKDLNQEFANTIVKNYKNGDIIWINDYHLMLVPGMVRQKIPNATIGFFLHIPFPSSELFRCLPPRKELLEAMLQSDMIGFQTYSFARHFLQTCSRILSVDATPTGIQLDTHYCSVGIHPIGIDIVALQRKISNPEVDHWVTKLKEKYAGKRLIVARDKLDYIKGVRQKLLAFEEFLIRHPEWRGKVVLIQIALSTSEQNELRAHISDVVSRINFKFSTISYQPIVFLHQDISFSQYLALLTCADTCLLTPLRDGMNLTSHEYIVCQRETHNPLILSEFTGTYGSFGASIRVNPWDYRQIGEAIHDALSMGEDEKTARWNELYKSIETNSSQHFASSIISTLSKIHSQPSRRFSTKIPKLNATILNEVCQPYKKRLFLFDYGGTLIPHGKPPGSNDLDRVLELLTKLASNPDNAVYVISGRTKINVDTDLGLVPNLGLSAENGFYIKPRGEDWQQVYDNVDFSWKPTVKEIFQYYSERTPGAYVETKDTSIVWHYRTTEGTDSQYVSWQAAECQNHIADSVNKNFAVHAVIGNTTIEVIPHDINKSSIANRILQDTAPDFVLAIGDDRSDEDMFTFLNKQKNLKVITCTVGTRSTEARYYIPNVETVLSTLEQLSF